MILDTNALSALAGRKSDLRHKILSYPRLVLNLISLGEYQYGIDGSNSKDELKNWLKKLMDRCEILSPSINTLRFYSEIRHQLKRDGHPIPANDIWIAALCKESGMELLSRDKHFDYVKGVKRISW